MTEALSEQRLAEIRRDVDGTCSCCGYEIHDFEVADVLDLLAEVDRLKAHLQVSFGASEALCENANQLDADCRRLREVAAEMLAAFRNDVHPGYAAKQSYMVPVETISKWEKAIWPLLTVWSPPMLAEVEADAAG